MRAGPARACCGLRAACCLLAALAAPARTDTESWPSSVTLQEGAVFEYIVVGGGAAGCAAAARLAGGGARVLLLEAGGPPPALSAVPAAAMALSGSAADWRYRTERTNRSCLAAAGGACRFSRGRCLGGSTAINYMLHSRGNRRDYEYGLPGWTWPQLEPYFPRLQPAGGGGVRLGCFQPSGNPWSARLRRAYAELGFPSNPDVDGASQIGVARLRGFVHGGRRESAARAYLARARRPRPLVATDALGARVLLDDSDTARGVLVLQDAAEVRVFARREVLLAAGAVGTPQLLMLSGVGPAEHLAARGVRPRVDLPVGEHMSDHVLPMLVVLVDGGRPPVTELRAALRKVAHVVRYLRSLTGPMASVGVADVSAFANTRCYESRRLSNRSEECELPSVQFSHWFAERGVLPLAPAMAARATGLGEPTLAQIVAANERAALLVVAPLLLTPRSRGYVRLASRDPRAPPLIRPGYLDDERDLDEMVRAIRVVRDLVRTEAFRARNASLLRLELGGCGGRGAQYWRCYARHMTAGGQHAAGTAALGRVLDAALRVRGVRRLRVADLSALPVVPRGNTAAAAIALGERAAHFMLREQRLITCNKNEQLATSAP